MSLSAMGVTARYAGAAHAALRDLHFRIDAGEFVVVAGPNGSGKSTLLRVLLGIEQGMTGNVTFRGRTIGEWSRAELAQAIAMLPQREEPTFSLLVREIVMLGRWAALGPVAQPGARDHAAVAATMEACRISQLADRPTNSLSGGEWQRVRLARALVAEPEYLILDEPGTALDIAHEMALYDLLHAQVTKGRGVLAVTHHLNAAMRYATRVILLKEGRVVADGAPVEVLASDTVSRVFDWPISVVRLEDGAVHLIPQSRHDIPEVVPVEPPSPFAPESHS